MNKTPCYALIIIFTIMPCCKQIALFPTCHGKVHNKSLHSLFGSFDVKLNTNIYMNSKRTAGAKEYNFQALLSLSLSFSLKMESSILIKIGPIL